MKSFGQPNHLQQSQQAAQRMRQMQQQQHQQWLQRQRAAGGWVEWQRRKELKQLNSYGPLYEHQRRGGCASALGRLITFLFWAAVLFAAIYLISGGV